jgi:hypothetical protein
VDAVPDNLGEEGRDVVLEVSHPAQRVYLYDLLGDEGQGLSFHPAQNGGLAELVLELIDVLLLQILHLLQTPHENAIILLHLR